jgi:cyanate lyase
VLVRLCVPNTSSTEAIMEAKFKKGTTRAAMSQAVGLSEIFVTSICHGQNSFTADQAAKLTGFLDLGNSKKDVEIALQQPPLKSQDLDNVAKDPVCAENLIRIDQGRESSNVSGL